MAAYNQWLNGFELTTGSLRPYYQSLETVIIGTRLNRPIYSTVDKAIQCYVTPAVKLNMSAIFESSGPLLLFRLQHWRERVRFTCPEDLMQRNHLAHQPPRHLLPKQDYGSAQLLHQQ